MEKSIFKFSGAEYHCTLQSVKKVFYEWEGNLSSYLNFGNQHKGVDLRFIFPLELLD